MNCNLDCFNCSFSDCINDELTEFDVLDSSKLDSDVLIERYSSGRSSQTVGLSCLYYLNNREARILYARRYYESHRSERIDYQRSRYARNRDELIQYQMHRYYLNREKLKEYQREYYKKNREVIMERQRERRLRKKLEHVF